MKKVVTLKAAFICKDPSCRLADGSAYWMDRILSTGNAVIPVQAALAFIYLWDAKESLKPEKMLQ